MPSGAQSKTRKGLEHSICGLLDGHSVEEWVEKRASRLITEARLVSPPFRFTRRVLDARRITEVRYIPEQLPERGRLVIGNDSFVIEVQAGGRWPHLVAAHEYAHTLLYNIDQWPPIPLTPFPPGSPALEWLCRYLARCLLAPSEWLNAALFRRATPREDGFSLSMLREFSDRVFCVPERMVAQRLVEDLQRWACILMSFHRAEEGIGLSGRDAPVWRLLWRVAPTARTEGLFVPVGHWDGRAFRHPKARGELASMLDSLLDEHRLAASEGFDLELSKIDDRATGNMADFLRRMSGSEWVRAYFAIWRESRDVFERGQVGGRGSVLLCVPC